MFATLEQLEKEKYEGKGRRGKKARKKDDMRPGPTPERVLEVCRLVNGDKYSYQDLYAMCGLVEKPEMGQEAIESSIEAAEDLGLIEEVDGVFELKISPESLESAQKFRKEICPIIFANCDGIFFKLTEWYIANADQVLRINRFDDFAAIAAKNGVESVTENDVLGWRFWMRYLGHAYQYSKTLIPNMKIRLEDALASIPIGTKMTCTQFVAWLKENVPEAANSCTNASLPLAVSNGLRTLQNEGIIELISTRDAIRTGLYPLKGVELNDFSDIVIKEN